MVSTTNKLFIPTVLDCCGCGYIKTKLELGAWLETTIDDWEYSNSFL